MAVTNFHVAARVVDLGQNKTHIFINSAGFILFVTGVAKIISGLGEASILDTIDPVFGLKFRDLFVIIGLFELGIAALCIFGKGRLLSLGMIAFLGTNFALYRGSLYWLGYHKPCTCLGNLTDYIHLSPTTADVVMKCLLLYLIVGSYLGLSFEIRASRARVNH